jgi:hypothetical protein
VKDSKMNTKLDSFFNECESITAMHETVYELLNDTEFNQIVLDSDFESIRTTLEEMQTLVATFYTNDNFSKDSDFVELSIELYQNAKYSIEALTENDEDESITDTKVLELFDSIRDCVDNIRSLVM